MPRTPLFVWTDTHGQGRNVFALFRRRFKLAQVPQKAELHLFADTRYRLRVNGQVAAYGPARFVPKAPEYDSVDLAPFLVKGWNVVLVEANSKGASSFDAMPSIGGFIAWGRFSAGGTRVDFATPGAWEAQRATTWDEDAPAFSFAQGPVEIQTPPPSWGRGKGRGAVDAAPLPTLSPEGRGETTAWQTPVVLARQDAWGALRPRSIPMLSMRERVPLRTLLVAPLKQDEIRIGYRVAGASSSKDDRRCTCYATNIFSPAAQEVTLALFWGPHFLNGEELKADGPSNHRQTAKARLRQGWNFLYGEPQVMTEAYGVLIGLPADKGLLAAAEPREDCADVMLRVDSLSETELNQVRARVPGSFAELPHFATPWLPVPRGAALQLPAREMGWDKPGEAVEHDPAVIANIAMPASGDATAVFDFGGEYLGHVVLDVEAPPGTVFNVAYTERLREDGALDLFKTHWMVNEADRFVARGGAERIEGFHPRGGRYLQVTARVPRAALLLAARAEPQEQALVDKPPVAHLSPVILRRVAVRQTTYPLDVTGQFECSDPFFNWLWQAGVQTLQACMEDAYLDCPWRERGCYLGDMLVEYHVTRAATADAALVRRCLWLAATAQRADGQIPGCIPVWPEMPLGDYALIWVILLRDYWAATADRKFVEEVWPCVARLFASSMWKEEKSGLWRADGLPLFFDWGAPKETKTGASGPLNAFRYKALCDAAELAAAIGKRAESAKYKREAARVKACFQRTLWDARRGVFVESRLDGKFAECPPLHTNVLALFFGLARPGDQQGILDFLESKFEDNLKLVPHRLETYFFYYLLGALYAHGRTAAAETIMRRQYAPMQAAGAWTLWEHFSGNSSLCHAWSGAPLHYFHARILGVRQVHPGKDDEFIVAPQAAGVRWARGAVPHRRGVINVAWELEGNKLKMNVRAPRGVRVRVAPG